VRPALPTDRALDEVRRLQGWHHMFSHATGVEPCATCVALNAEEERLLDALFPWIAA
jgi:hypothetical protein